MKLTKKLVNTGDSKSIRSKSRRFIKKKQQRFSPHGGVTPISTNIPPNRRHKRTNTQAHKRTNTQAHKRTNTQAHKPTGPQAHKPTGPQAHKPTGPQAHKQTSAQTPGTSHRVPSKLPSKLPSKFKRKTNQPTTQPTKRIGASLSVEDVVRDHLRIMAPRAHTDTTNNMTKKLNLFKKMDDNGIVFNTIQNSNYVESKDLSFDLNALSKLINASDSYYRGNINNIKEKYYKALEKNYKALEENEMTPTSFKDNYMIVGFGGTQEFKKQGNPGLNDIGKIALLNLLDNLLETLSSNLEVYKKRLVDEEQPRINRLIEYFRNIYNEEVSNKDTLEASEVAEILRRWNIISTTNVAVLIFLNKDIGEFLQNYHIKQSNIVRIRNLLENQKILLIQNQQTLAHSTRMRDAHNAVAGTEHEPTSDEYVPTPEEMRWSPQGPLGVAGITPVYDEKGNPR